LGVIIFYSDLILMLRDIPFLWGVYISAWMPNKIMFSYVIVWDCCV